ncbi:Hypothetical_protein [Hexamita inflata]|uniref:Hypothetical_protein n=1 Tax=Hexamita inflata TaxID=28002 RepID=A0AA86PYQ9_9EUKA|nr:Hypothetical protein HINF_LOCUS31270 [Hexamita inflata]
MHIYFYPQIVQYFLIYLFPKSNLVLEVYGYSDIQRIRVKQQIWSHKTAVFQVIFGFCQYQNYSPKTGSKFNVGTETICKSICYLCEYLTSYFSRFSIRDLFWRKSIFSTWSSTIPHSLFAIMLYTARHIQSADILSQDHQYFVQKRCCVLAFAE